MSFKLCLIPRPRGRGPIEAVRRGTTTSRSLAGFHDREVVAPLKPRCRCLAGFIVVRFHDREVVAPLKPSVEPLRAAQIWADSTTARSWPH